MLDSKPWIGKNWLEKQSTSIESQTSPSTDLKGSVEEVFALDGQGFSKIKRIWLHISLLWKAPMLQGEHKQKGILGRLRTTPWKTHPNSIRQEDRNNCFDTESRCLVYSLSPFSHSQACLTVAKDTFMESSGLYFLLLWCLTQQESAFKLHWISVFIGNLSSIQPPISSYPSCHPKWS